MKTCTTYYTFTTLSHELKLLGMYAWFTVYDEIDVCCDSFNLINRSENKYYSYVVYTKKEYHTIGLGFMYKKELVSPHIDFCVEKIYTEFNHTELNEIIKIIDDIIEKINNDIDYLISNPDIISHEHYYGEYNKGFDSEYRFETISDVTEHYKKVS